MDEIRTSRTLILLALLACLTAYTYSLRYGRRADPARPDLSSIPRDVGAFHSRDELIPAGSLAMLGADTTLARSYADSSGISIELFIGYFSRQQENSQIHSPKHCYPGSGWDVVSEGKIGIRFAEGTIPVKQLVISNGAGRQMVIYWFQMKGSVVPDEFALKFNQMKNAILSRPQSAAFIRFSAPIGEGGPDQAAAVLARLIEGLTAHISNAFDPAPAEREQS